MNIYYGLELMDNYYAKTWLKIFNDKEKNADLLVSIISTDFEDEEDMVIGYEVLAKYIIDNNIYVSQNTLNNIVDNIKINLENVEHWFYGMNIKESLIKHRHEVIVNCINQFNSYKNIIPSNYCPLDDIKNIINKQVANGDSIEVSLTKTFETLKDIAKKEYGISAQISLPKEVIDSIEEVMKFMINQAGDDICKITNISNYISKLWKIINKKKWSI
jgi:hypothetical protein